MILRLVSRRIFHSIIRSYAAKSPPVEPKFSQSAAFQGKKRGSGLSMPAYQMDYYSSDGYGMKKLFSALGSLALLILYFGYLREPSDLDEVWATPPHILTANLERKMLKDQIKQARDRGESTELLVAQLEYVDVKEEALKIQFNQKNKKIGTV